MACTAHARCMCHVPLQGGTGRRRHARPRAARAARAGPDRQAPVPSGRRGLGRHLRRAVLRPLNALRRGSLRTGAHRHRRPRGPLRPDGLRRRRRRGGVRADARAHRRRAERQGRAAQHGARAARAPAGLPVGRLAAHAHLPVGRDGARRAAALLHGATTSDCTRSPPHDMRLQSTLPNCNLCCNRLQPPLPTVTASIAHGGRRAVAARSARGRQHRLRKARAA